MDKRLYDITDPSIITPADNCTDLYFKLFNNMYDGLSLFEIAGGKVRALYLNERYFDTVGYTREQYEPYLDNITVTLFEEDEQRIMENAAVSLSEGVDFLCEVRGYRFDGSVGWFSVRARVVDFIKCDNPVFLASITDITAKTELSRQLTINRERFRILEETSTIYLFEYNPNLDLMTFSPGMNKPDIVLDSYSGYLRRKNQLHPYDAVYFFSDLCKASRKEYKGFDDVRSYNEEKTSYLNCRLYYSSIADEYGTIISVVGRNEFLSEKAVPRIHALDTKRSIDFLPSPAEAFPMIEKKIEAHKDTAFMLIADIDDFSLFNETYGKENASSAITLTASIIKDIFSDAIIFRYIGDEFVIFIDNISEAKLYDLIDKLRVALITMEMSIAGETTNTPLSISIGASWAAPGCAKANIKDYFITADKALLTAKREGKNRLETEKIFF